MAKKTNLKRIEELEQDLGSIKDTQEKILSLLQQNYTKEEETEEEEQEEIVTSWKPESIRERIEGFTTTEFSKYLGELKKNGCTEETLEKFKEVFREIVDERISGKAIVKETKGKAKSKKPKRDKPVWKNENEYVNYVLENAETIYANKKAGLNQIFPSGKQFTEIDSNTVAYFIYRDLIKPLIEKRDFKALKNVKIPKTFKGKKQTYDVLALAPSLKNNKHMEK